MRDMADYLRIPFAAVSATLAPVLLEAVFFFGVSGTAQRVADGYEKASGLFESVAFLTAVVSFFAWCLVLIVCRFFVGYSARSVVISSITLWGIFGATFVSGEALRMANTDVGLWEPLAFFGDRGIALRFVARACFCVRGCSHIQG
jgi:hypothetical protein